MPKNALCRKNQSDFNQVQIVTREEAALIVATRTPRGSFTYKENDTYIGIDNITGDAWVEEFEHQEDCIKWLIERDEKAEEIREHRAKNEVSTLNIGIEKEVLEKELKRLSSINDKLEKNRTLNSEQSILQNTLGICELAKALRYCMPFGTVHTDSSVLILYPTEAEAKKVSEKRLECLVEIQKIKEKTLNREEV